MPLSKLLKERSRSQTLRGARKDGAHLALVVECGGMRGVAASGAFKALSDAGLGQAFDSVHGSSAGACAGAYFFTGQLEAGRAIYLEDICNRRVVNPYGFLSHPSMVNTDFIADEVIGRRRRIDADKIIGEPGAFCVVTSAVGDGKARRISSFASLQAIVDALRASLRVPGIRERGYSMLDERHLDGGLVAPIAMDSALLSGATHVVVVGTQRAIDGKELQGAPDYERRALTCLYGTPLAQGYMAGQAQRRSLYRGDVSLRVETLLLARPQESPYCAWHTIDGAVLRAVEAASQAAARTTLSAIVG